MFYRIPLVLVAASIFWKAEAFTIEVQSYECQDRSVMAEFTDFCHNNMTCSFGEMAYISGIINLTSDVANSWGATSDTMVYVDSRLHIATYSTQLLKMEPIYLCHQYYLKDYDANNNQRRELGGNTYNFGNYYSGSSNSCPTAGLYAFENVPLQLPNVTNRVMDWAATGWTGSVSIDMYMDSSKYQLIGRCQLNLVTHMDNSTSSGNIMNTFMGAVPEASMTGMIILGTLAGLAFLCFAGYAVSKADLAEEESMSFKPMQKVEVA